MMRSALVSWVGEGESERERERPDNLQVVMQGSAYLLSGFGLHDEGEAVVSAS